MKIFLFISFRPSKPQPIKSPPPPPPVLSGSSKLPTTTPDRSSLLSDIRNPKIKLNKVTEVNDRSGPQV